MGIAKVARSRGFDPSFEVEIPFATDLPERVEKLMKVPGVAKLIRECDEKDRDILSLRVAEELALQLKGTTAFKLTTATKVALAIQTEGILVAPLDGLTEVRIGKNTDNTTYADMHFSGPIRSAGGTGQALSVLACDVVRKTLGVGVYKATKEEVERMQEEMSLYKKSQYKSSRDEVGIIMRKCPVCINGDGTQEREVSGHRDLPRVEGNRVRGGACLVMAEGICLKAGKINDRVAKEGIEGWDFIDEILQLQKKSERSPEKIIVPKEDEDIDGEEFDVEGELDDNDELEADEEIGERRKKYIKDIVGGRPIFSHPSKKGGFRLRYGRSRCAGLASVSVNPATMYILDEFMAIGTQVKVERPGKATAVTPCESIEGPMVLLENGDFLQVETVEEAKKVCNKVKRIVDLGEMLVPFGEFAENKQNLVCGAYSIEWHEQEILATGKLPENWKTPSVEEAFTLSRNRKVPLHPNFNFFWHDLTRDEILHLRSEIVSKGRMEEEVLLLDKDAVIKDILIKMGALHKDSERHLLVKNGKALILTLGLESSGSEIGAVAKAGRTKNPLKLVSLLAGVTILSLIHISEPTRPY